MDNKLDYTIRRNIDMLKGIAMIMVILVHSRQMFYDISGIFHIFSFGQMGVQLFFLISGFTLTMSWCNKDFETRKDSVQFIVKRYLSIAPGYYLGIGFYFILNFILANIIKIGVPIDLNTDINSILINILMLNGLFPFCNNNVVPGGWYIGTLMLIYILFPIVIDLYIKKKKYYKIIPVMFLITSVVIQGIILMYTGTSKYSSNNSFMYFNIINQLPCFLLGINLYFDFKNKEFLGVNILKIVRNFIIYLIISILLFFLKIDFMFSIIPFICARAFYWLFILTIEKFNCNKSRLLRNISEILINIGRQSFSIYLSHWILVWYTPYVLLVILKHYEIAISHTVLYLIMLPAIIIGSYYLSFIFNRIIRFVNSKIKIFINKDILNNI